MSDSARKLSVKIKIPDRQTLLLYLWFANLITLTVVRFALSSVGFDTGLFRDACLWFAATVPLLMYVFYNRGKNFRNTAPFIVLIVAVVFFWVISALLNPNLWEFLTRESYGPDRIFRPDAPLYAFLFFMMFDDPKKLLKNITAYAYVFFVYEIILSLLPALSRGYWINIGPSGQEIHLSYSLSFGYSMCFPAIVFMHKSFKDRKLIHIFMAVASFWCILTNGNRGALLIPIIYVALMIVSRIVGDSNVTNKVIKIIFVLILGGVVYLFGEYIFGLIVSAMATAGISSRNIEMLLQGSFGDNNGREIIWVTVIQAIRSGGILGYGMYGDRPFVSQIHYVGYSHNIFLELIVSFGIIGVLIIIWIIRDAVHMIFFCKDSDWRELYIIFFAISCQLLISLSLWYVWEFWAAAAIAYKYRHIQKARSIG